MKNDKINQLWSSDLIRKIGKSIRGTIFSLDIMKTWIFQNIFYIFLNSVPSKILAKPFFFMGFFVL